MAKLLDGAGLLGAALLLALAAGCGGGGSQVDPTCTDGLMNGQETDLDCGGACGPCAAGGGCLTRDDCSSQVCVEQKCAAPSCDDDVRNGYETDLNCGGTCPGCPVDSDCQVGANCESGSCGGGKCLAPSCSDWVQNGDEQGPDCGGACGPCADGLGCLDDLGCQSGHCLAGLCRPPACDDQRQNGLETGEDCGGPDCDPCPDLGGCAQGSDCASRMCRAGLCQAATCQDGVRNGEELGTDCAGGCDPCPGGQPCVLNLDCLSQRCTAGVCEAPTCADLLTNGDETAVDCGGTCPPCEFNEHCLVPRDCQSGICGANGRCAFGESCAHVLSASPGSPSGLYLIDPELDGYEPLWAWCDMVTDGGGWTLVLNYLHLGGTNPQLYNSPDGLPWLVSSALGEDEQGTYSWRHTQNGLFSKLAVEELRFFGVTSAHGRLLHFTTRLQGCIDYFTTGQGSCAGIQHGFEALPGHDARLPEEADTFLTDRGNQAMTDFPFCRGDADPAANCWAARGWEQHWAVDSGRSSSAFDTLQRIFVRAAPSHCRDGSRNVSEVGLDCGGGLCPGCVDTTACSRDEDCAGLCLNGSCTTLANCTEILIARPGASDGDYLIDADGAGPLAPMRATCDMTTRGGGWTLALNYLHRGGTDPMPTALADRLPARGSDRLGKDEQGTDSWGHASASLLAALAPREARFFARSRAHERIVDFTTGSTDCLAYLAGQGGVTCGDVGRAPILLPDHTAQIPGELDGAADLAEVDWRLTSQPFYLSQRASWNVGLGTWNVDEWQGGSEADTLHRVWIRSIPQHCSNGSADAGETDLNCGGTCPTGCAPAQACLVHADCQTGLCDQGTCALAADCAQLLAANPAAPSGDYLVDVDGDGALAPLTVSCDMTSAGGGWTLVLNYLHQGGTNPATVFLGDRLPTLGNEVLGPDESGTAHWGHVEASLLARLDVDEVRFQGRTSGHARRMDFSTTDAACISYLVTGAGAEGCAGLALDHRILPGHTAYLPQEADMFASDAGPEALLFQPFITGWSLHWVVGVGGRWELDDWANGPENSTLHRVWVRGAPAHCASGVADGGEEGVDCGGPCPRPCDRVDAGQPCAAHGQCLTGACVDGTCQTQPDCTALLAVEPGATSGDYLIDPDGELGAVLPMMASCDMLTDGGGWTLVLEYLHLGGTDPVLSVRDGLAVETALPRRGPSVLGRDGSLAAASWGHAGNQLFALLNPAEVRFYGRSSSHTRHLHFKTGEGSTLSYLSTGSGNCMWMSTDFTALFAHDAILPGTMDSGYSDQGDLALTSFPFYLGGTAHWGIGASGRWEADDYAGNNSLSTLHRVWVRGAP
ncbi:MAG TPA: fibrinogen-like YCDxxxxGGGW domain-containing protein [Myxococcota bacterium]|nr:fibrinogen-like YCDxxxxGGGW domain-containing protein [Myxococcota bacterium]HRY92286.1 fibrinogen-like YCDxxxxGGGW domain-containing protein [Myxococcota bacterium]